MADVKSTDPGSDCRERYGCGVPGAESVMKIKFTKSLHLIIGVYGRFILSQRSKI